MTFITRRLSRAYFTSVTIALLLSLVAFSANALDKEQASSVLEKIYQTQIHSYYSVNGFYNFSANLGDQQQLDTINESIDQIDERMSSLEEELSEADTVETLNMTLDAWKKYKSVLNQNVKEVKKTGYPDLRLAGDMASTNIAFNEILEELYNLITSTPSNKPDDLTANSRRTAITLALMMTKYSARSTSTVSQVYTGGDTEITIDSLAKTFDATLSELLATTKENKSAQDWLNSANTKWSFIQPSYLNYNENRVNFIVNLYSKKIISDIESASAAF